MKLVQLIYRGTTYLRCLSKTSCRPFQQVREPGSAYNLTYRGVPYRVDPNAKPAEVTVKLEAYKLMYRGISYLVNRNAQGEVIIVTLPGRHVWFTYN